MTSESKFNSILSSQDVLVAVELGWHSSLGCIGTGSQKHVQRILEKLI